MEWGVLGNPNLNARINDGKRPGDWNLHGDSGQWKFFPLGLEMHMQDRSRCDTGQREEFPARAVIVADRMIALLLASFRLDSSDPAVRPLDFAFQQIDLFVRRRERDIKITQTLAFGG